MVLLRKKSWRLLGLLPMLLPELCTCHVPPTPLPVKQLTLPTVLSELPELLPTLPGNQRQLLTLLPTLLTLLPVKQPTLLSMLLEPRRLKSSKRSLVSPSGDVRLFSTLWATTLRCRYR
jgi:hypothetical protein